MMTKNHSYFMLSSSPWPLVASLNSFTMLFSLMLFLKFGASECLFYNLMNISFSSFIWWTYYSGEFNIEGKNSSILEQGLKYSMLLFISSEILFFFSFFWSYYHYFLAPTMDTGLMWPPVLIQSFDCLNVPLINTLILLTSGVTVTISHHYLITGKNKTSATYLALTFLLGVIFTMLQGMEYMSSFFCISDATFGTSFFMLTGFHGIHVIIGTIFLGSILIRFASLSSGKNSGLSFELSSWYWHFVDVVWIFLYFSLYYLNN